MAQNVSAASYKSSNWIMLAFAVWLFISPWIFAEPTGSSVGWNFWIVGVIMGVLAIIALFNISQWEDWINLALSVWLFFSPWIVGFSDNLPLAWDAYIVAVLTAITSIWGIASARQSLGGHVSHP